MGNGKGGFGGGWRSRWDKEGRPVAGEQTTAGCKDTAPLSLGPPSEKKCTCGATKPAGNVHAAQKVAQKKLYGSFKEQKGGCMPRSQHALKKHTEGEKSPGKHFQADLTTASRIPAKTAASRKGRVVKRADSSCTKMATEVPK